MAVLHAGLSVVDITPEPGVPMWGYKERHAPAAGVLDPLYAKALVLGGDGPVVAVVSVDLGRVPMPEARARIEARARDAGVDAVFLAATHTHHGPVMELPDLPHARRIEDQIGACIEAAAAALQPVRIGFGSTTFDIAHNRRVVAGGQCRMLWRNEARKPTAPIDPAATLIKITGLDGQPLALLVHYACHPVVMGPSNLLYSADYPGEMCRLVKEATGAECLFLQGACGNINPYLDKTPVDDGAVDAMRAVGAECAAAVLAAQADIATGEPDAALGHVEQPVRVGTRWDLSDAGSVERMRAAYGPMYDYYVQGLNDEFAVPLSVVTLGRELALAGMPGEVFIQFQLDLKENSPISRTLLCGYVNGYYAYFPTVKDAAAGGYGGTVATFVGPGAGERLTTEAKVAIARLMGNLSPVCSVDDLTVHALQEDPRNDSDENG